MKYTPSIAFDEMSGSAKGVTAAKVRGRKYIRNKGNGGFTRSSSQSSVKAIFKQLSQSWKNLTNSQILAWNALANTQAGKSVLGTSSKISGANLYMRLNYWVVYCGGTALTEPPMLKGVIAPSNASINIEPEEFSFRLNTVPADVTNLKLIIQASAPQGNGITRAYGKCANISGAITPVSSDIDLADFFAAKYTMPNAAYPKVFFKWFYVNPATGEKSGEMLDVESFVDPDTP